MVCTLIHYGVGCIYQCLCGAEAHIRGMLKLPGLCFHTSALASINYSRICESTLESGTYCSLTMMPCHIAKEALVDWLCG